VISIVPLSARHARVAFRDSVACSAANKRRSDLPLALRKRRIVTSGLTDESLAESPAAIFLQIRTRRRRSAPIRNRDGRDNYGDSDLSVRWIFHFSVIAVATTTTTTTTTTRSLRLHRWKRETRLRSRDTLAGGSLSRERARSDVYGSLARGIRSQRTFSDNISHYAYDVVGAVGADGRRYS